MYKTKDFDPNIDNKFYSKKSNKKKIDFTIERIKDGWVLKKGSLVHSAIRWKEINGQKFAAKHLYMKHIGKVDKKTNRVNRDINHKSLSHLVAFANGNKSNNGWVSIINKNLKTPHDVYRK